PFNVLYIDDAEAAALYAKKLVLVRPDRHVAWRADVEPDDPLALIDLIRGVPAMVSRERVLATAPAANSPSSSQELAGTIHVNETLGAPSARAIEKLFAAINAEEEICWGHRPAGAGFPLDRRVHGPCGSLFLRREPGSRPLQASTRRRERWIFS